MPDLNNPDKYPFDADFQKKIAALLFQDWQFLCQFRDLIKAGYFEAPEIGSIVNTAFGLYDKYKEPLTLGAVKATLDAQMDVDERALYEFLFEELDQEIPMVEQRAISDLVVDFVQQAEIKNIILSAPSRVQKKELPLVVEELRSALAIGSEREDLGSWFFKDIDKRIEFRNQLYKNVVRTMIPKLDSALIGKGLIEGDLMIALAPPNRGKSWFLVHMAKAALFQRKKVVFYTLEMGQHMIGTREEASILGMPLNDIYVKPLHMKKKLYELRELFDDEQFLIKYFPIDAVVTVDTIRAHLNRLHGIGFVPDIIVIDYLNLMSPLHRGRDRDLYGDGRSVANSLKSLAEETRTRICTAMQANRSGASKSKLGMDSAADSYAYGFIADIIFALEQSTAEATHQIMRCRNIKNRNEVANFQFAVKTDFARGLFHAPITDEEMIELLIKADSELKPKNTDKVAPTTTTVTPNKLPTPPATPAGLAPGAPTPVGGAA